MKRGFILLFVIFLVVAACKKNVDSVFNQSPDERINTALASYQSKLTGAVNGWKASLTVNNGKGATYSFFFKFNTENRVKMFSDFNPTSAVTPQESSYRLKAEQQPTLIFDTYSYVHVLADPNEATVDIVADINGGPVGQGLLSDFEFILDEAKIKTDTMELAGKVNHSRLLLIRATQAEEDAFNNGGLGRSLSFHNISGSKALNGKLFNYWKHLTINGVTFEIDERTFNPITRTITFKSYNAAGNIDTFTTKYRLSSDGVEFERPFTVGANTVTGFSNLSWDVASNTLSASLAGTTTTVVISGSNTPLKVDLSAPKNWRDKAITDNSYWYSVSGFRVNGVDDAYNINSLSSSQTDGLHVYYYFIYYPAFGSNYDLAAPVFLNPAQNSVNLFYGYAAINSPTSTILKSNGTAVFSSGGSVGTEPVSGPYVDTKTQIRTNAGFYFVKTENGPGGGESYDMISASDSKIWLSWYGFP